MNKIILNKTLCTGCKTCFRACFIDVIRWDEERRQPIIAYPDDCVQCNYCVVNCPTRAIKVVPNYETYEFPRDAVAVAGARRYEYLKKEALQ
jgi:NAD-dependent dihydropyrimidine dehydrogenase PreA subunit